MNTFRDRCHTLGCRRQKWVPIAANIELSGLRLTAEDVAAIDSLAGARRQ